MFRLTLTWFVIAAVVEMAVNGFDLEGWPPRAGVKVEAGKSAVLYCKLNAAGGAYPEPDIYWSRNGHRLEETSNLPGYTVSRVGSAIILRINEADVGRDTGSISCEATNGYYDIHIGRRITVIVYPAGQTPPGYPTITTSPSVTKVEEGASARLECAASGDPSPTIYWLKDSIPIDTNDYPKYIALAGPLSGTLMITNSRAADEGQYECVAQNTVGLTISAPAQFIVGGTPASRERKFLKDLFNFE